MRPEIVRARGRRSRRGALDGLMRDLNALYREHLQRRATRGGMVGVKTMRERRVVIEAALRGLHEDGFKLRRLHNLRARHLRAVVQAWKRRGLKASTLSTNFSHLRTLCRWCSKHELVAVIDEWIAEDPSLTLRRAATEFDRSERRIGVHSATLIRRSAVLDERFSCQLALMSAFGLRVLEAWLLRPHQAAEGASFKIERGTKGGRPRRLPTVLSAEQLLVLEWAKSLSQTATDSMIPRGWSIERWRRRFYRLCRRVGLTRSAMGITAHSLRHGYLQDLYEQLTGHASPARGGTLRDSDQELDRHARDVTSEAAGHSRRSVSSAYLGGIYRARLDARQPPVCLVAVSDGTDDVDIGKGAGSGRIEPDDCSEAS